MDYGNRRLGFCPSSVTICITLCSFVVRIFLMPNIVNWSDSKDSSSSDLIMIKVFRCSFLTWYKLKQALLVIYLCFRGFFIPHLEEGDAHVGTRKLPQTSIPPSRTAHVFSTFLTCLVLSLYCVSLLFYLQPLFTCCACFFVNLLCQSPNPNFIVSFCEFFPFLSLFPTSWCSQGLFFSQGLRQRCPLLVQLAVEGEVGSCVTKHDWLRQWAGD